MNYGDNNISGEIQGGDGFIDDAKNFASKNWYILIAVLVVIILVLGWYYDMLPAFMAESTEGMGNAVAMQKSDQAFFGM